MKMKELPKAERPYEKLELYGAKSLSNAELLAIIIKTGTKQETSVQIAQRILTLNHSPEDDSLSFLQELSLADLQEIKGIGTVKAIQLKAICELGLRMVKPSNYKNWKIEHPKDIARICIPEFKKEKREIGRVYFLNSQNQVLQIDDLAIGGTSYVNISIKEIMAHAIGVRASRLILVHNHPSGIAKPSGQDIKFSDELFNAAKLLNIDLLDHLIIAGQNYISVYDYLRTKIEQLQNDHKQQKVVENKAKIKRQEQPQKIICTKMVSQKNTKKRTTKRWTSNHHS